MKVKELLEKLSKLPLNTEIEMSSDSEGNEFRPLHDIEYNPGNTMHERKVTLWPGF